MCGAAASNVAASSDLLAILRKMRDAAQRSPASVEAAFNAADVRGTGAVAGRELLSFLSRLPNAQPVDVRFLLAHLNFRDVARNGQVSLAEYKQAVGAVTPRITQGGAGGGAVGGGAGGAVGGGYKPAAAPVTAYSPPVQPAAVPNYAPAAPLPVQNEMWELAETSYNGRRLLEDTRTGKIFDPVPTAGAYFPVGWRNRATGMIEGVDKRDGDFFVQLDTYLRSAQARLEQLFNAADDDRSGTLDRGELARLVNEIMPRASQVRVVLCFAFWGAVFLRFALALLRCRVAPYLYL